MPSATHQAEHRELCLIAGNWLRKSAGCGTVITEMVSAAAEIPDAIGWKTGMSILVECKTSRGDFFADARKMQRENPEQGMGDWRVFLTPAGLVTPAEVPNGWGLLELHGNHVKRIHGLPPSNIWTAPPFQGNKQREVVLLCSALRRMSSLTTNRQ